MQPGARSEQWIKPNGMPLKKITEADIEAAGWERVGVHLVRDQWRHKDAPTDDIVDFKEAVRRAKIGRLPRKRELGQVYF